MAQATSIPMVINAPNLQGIWLHSTENPETTSSNYLFGNTARSETIEIQGISQRYIGRTHPVYDTGGFESQSLKLDIVIPYSETEQSEVEWFRTALRRRGSLCYRDNRGRKHFIMLAAMDIQDSPIGTVVSFTAQTVDYQEEV